MSELRRFVEARRSPEVVRHLAHPRWYLAEIDSLHEKYSVRQCLYELRQANVPFSAVSFDRKRLARVLADTVSRGLYEFEPAETRRIQVRGKERVIYEFRMTDRIVHGAVSSMLGEVCRPLFSPTLYSYIKGKSWCGAVASFARYVRSHRRQHTDPKERGLYVIRRDIRSYTDTIPVRDTSPLWPILDDVLRLDGQRPQAVARFRSLIKQIVRPDVYFDGRLMTRIFGVPTGSPISTLLFNAYLLPLDRALDSVPNGFYARYSDDFIFAHPDPEVVEATERRIDEVLHRLELSTNPSKDRRLFFNGAARESTAWPETRGVASLSFLGCEVAFDATVSLGRRKVRELLRELDRRARRTYRLVGSTPPEASGPAVCAAINAALTPEETSSHRTAIFLRRVITDRDQLKQLDYHVARIVLRALTGIASAKAFRTISYRTLRRDWNLLSLYHTRNRVARRG